MRIEHELAAIATVTLVSLGSPGTAQAQGAPDADLATGIQQVQDGYYEKAVITLDPVVRRLTGDAGHAKELERAYIYLGVAYVAVGRPDQAKAQFRGAIAVMRTEPEHRSGKIKDLSLASFGFSPKVTQVFEEAKREARVEAGEKDTTAKLPLILGGVALAGGGVAIALAKGESAAPPPSAAHVQVSFLGSTPPPGSTLRVVDRITFHFSLLSDQDYPTVFGGARVADANGWFCGAGVSDPVSLKAGQASAVNVWVGAWQSCGVAPFTTSTVRVSFCTTAAGCGSVQSPLEIASIILDATYTWVP